MDVQKQAPAVVAFLKGEWTRIEAACIAEATQAREDARRAIGAARSLVVALEAAGLAVDGALQRTAEGRLAGVAARKAIETGLLALGGRNASDGRSETSQVLAGRLSTGEVAMSLEGWLEKAGKRLEREIRRMDAAVAELEAVVGRAEATAFAARAEAADAEQDVSRRALLTDSLVLEAGRAVAAHRASNAARDRLEAAISGLEDLEAQAPTQATAELRSVSAVASGAEITRLAERAEAKLAEVQAEKASASRRRALLEGLAELGYEVRPSMSTALVERGRIVVRRPGGGDYGVEVAAPGATARVQVRLVGSASPATPRTAERDRDAETTWCGDVDRLRAALASAGAELVLVRAVEPGAEPVKTVALDPPPTAVHAETDVPRLVGRTT